MFKQRHAQIINKYTIEKLLYTCNGHMQHAYVDTIIDKYTTEKL